MPTLVWRRRPESDTDAAREGSAAVPDPVVSIAAAAFPDPVVSVSAVPASAQVALPVVSSKRCSAADGRKKRRKMNNSKAATAAKKKSKAKPKRDLPTGVYEKSPGKFSSDIRWCGKQRYIGTFDTPEQASAAFMSVKSDRGDAKLSALGADEANAFAAAKTKALEAVGVFVPKKRDLPQGVYPNLYGKRFVSRIKWGGKQRYIGTFDTPDQASAAFMSVRKDLDDAKLHVSFGANEVQADDIFDAAKKKALETVQATMDSDGYGDEFLV